MKVVVVACSSKEFAENSSFQFAANNKNGRISLTLRKESKDFPGRRKCSPLAKGEARCYEEETKLTWLRWNVCRCFWLTLCLVSVKNFLRQQQKE